jgi:16S rRNA (guanine1207-N2)-methyltransferase
MNHYFSAAQQGKLKLKELRGVIRGKEVVLFSGAGTFSRSRLDKGGLLLANESILKKNWNVLDLGCGYGMVGIGVKKAFPSLDIVMVDVNERAVLLSKKNAKINKVDVMVKQSDVFSNVPELFDTILLNPPQKAGNKLCFRMILESKSHLKKKGLLQVVSRHRKGGKKFKEYMEEVYGNAETIARGSGYQVYASKT